MPRNFAIKVKNGASKKLHVIYEEGKGDIEIDPGRDHTFDDNNNPKTFIFSHKNVPSPIFKSEPRNCNIMLAGIRQIKEKEKDRMGLKLAIIKVRRNIFRRILLGLFPEPDTNVIINDDP